VKTISNTALADIFAQLSEFFKEPTPEFAADVESGRLRAFFEEAFAMLRLDSSVLGGLSVSGDAYAKIADEYRKLFMGPLPPYIVPVESVYKKWTSDPDCRLPIAEKKGYLMGDPAMDMFKRFQAHGIVIPDYFSSMPDHIGLELEYMAFLYGSADTGTEITMNFLTEHLDWIGELAFEIEKLNSRGFYATAARMTALVCSALLE
jgi:TorA maturation chaperone TorD